MANSGEASSCPEQVARVAVSIETASPKALTSNDRDLFDKVFTNDLVWKKLGSYLNLDDLKDCRRSCQLFNTKIIQLKSFKDRARLNVPLSKFRASDFGKTRVQWIHLAMHVDPDLDDKNRDNWWDYSDEPLLNLSPLLLSVISLKLQRSHSVIFPKVLPNLYFIFSMMPNIQQILIDVRIFQDIQASSFAKASVAFMSKVKEFRLECSSETSVPDEVMRCAMSLPLGSAQLEVFRMDSIMCKLDFDRPLDNILDRLDKLFLTVRQNQGHLRSFQVQDPEFWTSISAQRYGTLPKLPQLKLLKLTIDTEEVSPDFFCERYFIQFLNNLPDQLEEIDLEFKGPIPPAVFQILKHRIVNLSLKVLRIIATKLTETGPSDMKKWNFLKETNLEEFSFQMTEDSVQLSNDQLKDFFGSLPKTAKKLTIARVEPEGGQRILNLEVSKCFDPQALTHLNLRRCTGLLSDSVLQEIWKILKNLRLLDLSKCGDNCSDWGFTGVPVGGAPQGVSISLLKGLRSLTLQNCVGLTDRTLIDGLKLPQLRFLDLMGNLQFTDSGYQAVVSQNPSLQTLVSEDAHDGKRLSPLERRRKSVQINSRLTREFGQMDVRDGSFNGLPCCYITMPDKEDPWQGIGYQRDPPLGGGDGSEVDEEDEDELPDLD